MGHSTDVVIALLIPCLILFHLSIAPFSKVEESFNLQATHDILTFGIPRSDVQRFLAANYDHVTFTGSVPRTFVGPLALAGAAWPFAWIAKGVDRQIFVRAILGIYNSFSVLAYRNAISKRFGAGTANWYILFQASQFHIIFWASRTLPNFFAFGLSTFALGSLLPRAEDPKFRTSPTALLSVNAEKRALVILTFLGVVFRSELAILLAAHTLSLLIRERLSLKDIAISGATGAIIGLVTTISIDSFFWQQVPLWPELNGFFYNVLQGESKNWGTSPWHFYFTSSLPKLLFNPFSWLVCIPVALGVPALRRESLETIIPNLTFIIIYSLQPHKEWRFIVYAIPPLTAVVARGANWIWIRREKSSTQRILSLALLASIFTSFAASFLMLAVSSLNYPGADALNQLHATADGSQATIKVHMDTLSCMTGITRFLELPRPDGVGSAAQSRSLWLYDKTDKADEVLVPEFWTQFDYALVESPERAIGPWKIIHVVNGFSGIQIIKPGEGGERIHGELAADSLVRPWAYGEGPWAGFGRRMKELWMPVEGFVRKYITMGWWVAPRMEPKIYVLKRTIGQAGV